jgi:hypothetical protein
MTTLTERPTIGKRIVFRGANARAYESRAPQLLLAGPAGTGKTVAALTKLHHAASKHAGMRGLITRKTLASLGGTALDTWRKHVVDIELAKGLVDFYGGSAEEPPQYRYWNGSRIVIGGLDHASKVLSAEYDVIYVNEATECVEDDWETLDSRLRNGRMPYQQLLADCNPGPPTHWLRQRSIAGRTQMLESRHEDNPAYFNPDGTMTEAGCRYMARLDALTGVRYLRLRKGLWVAAEGIVFDEWDPAIHLVDRFDLPDDWPRYVGIDFGYTHAFVAQWWAEDPDGRLIMYRELVHTRRTVDQHAVTIMNAMTVEDPNYQPQPGRPRYACHGRIWVEPKPRAIICDHDAEGRAVLKRELGLGTVPATKAVQVGIQAVQRRLRRAGDGKPRLMVMRDSLIERDPDLVEAKRPTCLEEEIPGYVWDTGAGKALKEQPLKVDDDGCDVVRYVVAQVDMRGRPRVRMMG